MNPDLLESAILTAHRAGMPRDQIERFLKAGYVPQPKQCEFHAACRAADLPGGPVMIALGGDRAGAKSHGVMAQVSIDDCQRYPGLDILYLRKIGKAARKALDQLRAKTFINIPHNYNRVEGIIRFENGSTMIVGHYKDEKDIDQYIGIEYDVIVIEEATQLPQTKIDLLLGSLRSTKPGWRARNYDAANPGGIGHQDFKRTFVEPYRNGRETDTKFVPISWRDNAFVAPEYIAYLNSLSGILRRMWREGDWDVGAGQFFVHWNHDVHVIRPFPIPAYWRTWGSFDYGFAHPTSFHLHAQDEDGNIFTIAEHHEPYMVVEQHAAAIKALLNRLDISQLETIVAGRDCFARGKDREAKTIADQYAEYGLYFEPADVDRINGAAEMVQRLGNPEAGIPPSWFIFDTCVNLIEQIPVMMSDPKRPGDVLKMNADPDGNSGDDAYDDARYGLMYVKQPIPPHGVVTFEDEPVTISPY